MRPTGETWNGLRVYLAGLDEIRPRVKQIKKRKAFYNRLRESAAKEGIRNPLVVIKTDNQAMLDFYGPDRTSMHPLPNGAHKYWMIIVGNQRYWLMQEFGIKEARVVIESDVLAARRRQEQMREGFEHIHS